MSDIIHKIKDAVTHHEHAHDKKHTDINKKNKRISRTDMDLNGAPSATRDSVDLTGRHVEPDDRDIDGHRRSHSLDAPDLIGPHQDHDNVDINGRHPTTRNAPDLTSGVASPSNRH